MARTKAATEAAEEQRKQFITLRTTARKHGPRRNEN